MATNVKYFIPEDGDEQGHPNVFRATGNAQNLTLAQIKKVRYHLYMN
jgi:hypothetical protein